MMKELRKRMSLFLWLVIIAFILFIFLQWGMNVTGKRGSGRNITTIAKVNGISDDIEKVEFYVDGKLQATDYEEPYIWSWNKPTFLKHTLSATAYRNTENISSDDVIVWKFF